jgi:hypothetical protein
MNIQNLLSKLENKQYYQNGQKHLKNDPDWKTLKERIGYITEDLDDCLTGGIIPEQLVQRLQWYFDGPS